MYAVVLLARIIILMKKYIFPPIVIPPEIYFWEAIQFCPNCIDDCLNHNLISLQEIKKMSDIFVSKFGDD